MYDIADLGAIGRVSHVGHETCVLALSELGRDRHISRLDIAPQMHVAHAVGHGRTEPRQLQEEVHGIQLGLDLVVLAHAEHQSATEKQGAGVSVDDEADRFDNLYGLVHDIAASHDHVRAVEVVVLEQLQKAIGVDLSLTVGTVNVYRIDLRDERAKTFALLARIREHGIEVHTQEVVAHVEAVGEVQRRSFIYGRIRVALDGAAVLDVAHEVKLEHRFARDTNEIVGGIERPQPAISH